MCIDYIVNMVVFKWAIRGLFFVYYWYFSNKHYNFYNNII